MISVNALANILPINNTTTGDVSNAYPNLFAPAPVTFSIWGIIYAFLAAYTIYQSGLFRKSVSDDTQKLLGRINKYYVASSLANMFWIFSWHYFQIWLSVIFMLIILYCLIKVADITGKQKLSAKEDLLVRIPFSIYLAWITVATIANITTFLVSINWNGCGLSRPFWTISVLLIGAVIGLARMFKDKSAAFGLVLIWAYYGIWLKHTIVFNNQYPAVITATIICVGLFTLSEGVLLFLRKSHS